MQQNPGFFKSPGVRASRGEGMGTVVFALCSTLLGLALGSLATVLVARYDKPGMGLSEKPHWVCPECGRRLTWLEGLPLAGWLLVRGRCRGCGKPVSLRYPVMELVCGLWALAVALVYGPGAAWGVYLGFGWLFVVLSFIDFEHFLLPDIYTLPGSAVALACSALLLNTGSAWERLMPPLLGGLIGAGGFWIIHFAYRRLRGAEGLGLGDVKLMLVIGFLLGVDALPFVLLAATITALLASFWYLARPNAKGGRTRVPFGPFLCLGAMLWILAGDQVWAWYLDKIV